MHTLLIMLLISLTMFVGTFLVFLINNKKEKILGALLAFSSGIIISLLVFDIFGEVIEEIGIIMLIILTLLGYLISKGLDKLIPEHEQHNNKSSKNKNLLHIGIITLLGIVLHNLTEGIATFTIIQNNDKIFVPFIIGIAIHNIPLGIALASPIYYSTNNKKKTLIYTLIAVLSTMLGGLIGMICSSLFTKFNLPIYILGITSGMLTYVVTNELLPTAKRYNKKYMYAILIGIVCMILISMI